MFYRPILLMVNTPISNHSPSTLLTIDKGSNKMALVSSNVWNYLRIALLLTSAYFLLTDPRKLLEYSGVVIMSSAMNLPLIMYNEMTPNPLYGSISVLIGVISLSDLFALLDSNVSYFETVIPLRLFCYSILGGYIYFIENVLISNSLVFAFVFIEVWFHSLIYSTLREEKQTRLKEQSDKIQMYKEQFDRNELTSEQNEEIVKELEKQEFEKIMSEFR